MPESQRLDVPVYANRRFNARYDLDKPKQECRVRDEAGQEHPAKILDISAGGVGLLLERRIELGVYLSVALPTRDESGSRRFTLRVRKCEQEADGKWRVGCAFAHPLHDDELLLLM
ncbi:MAG TPA: PilZ domain-containing protein [Gemmataceae bacterium]|nr:PilZ domain-containing protein [Gemmataceae bacterium]